MTDPQSDRLYVKEAIRSSCIPLLYGCDRTVRKTARRLLFRHRLRSYALLTEEKPRLRPLPPYLKCLPTSCRDSSLHASLVLHFFAELDSSALPVLIDCTEEGIFLRNSSIRERLESQCFLSDPIHYEEIPPFCYLSGSTAIPRKEKE